MNSATIQLLTSGLGCQKCQKSKKKVKKIIEKYGNKVKLEEIDITKHPEKVKEYNIFSAPGIVLNKELIAEGTMDEENEEKLHKKIKESLGR